jgi:uncharacterized protein YqfA (UPF0365 family)
MLSVLHLPLAEIGLFWIVAAIVMIGIVLLVVLFAAQVVGLYVQAVLTRAGVGLISLITMRFRRVNPGIIVGNKIALVKAGIHDVTVDDLEGHYLAGGDVRAVCRAVIQADRAKLDLDWRVACAIDLAGRDVVDAVRTSVNPKVVDCPRLDPQTGTDRLDAVSKDGIRMLVKARVTVKTNIKALIGGATEETVIARVGQAIVSAIGSAETYKEVLENPDRIARRALDSGLSPGTAFLIVSVDIADVSVAAVSDKANVGASLQAEQAEADKRRFQAEAEKRAAMARAREAEMTALVAENRAKVVENEAQVPLAIAEAFRGGNLGIMDFYRMRNIEADTSMRNSIGGGAPKKDDSSGT